MSTDIYDRKGKEWLKRPLLAIRSREDVRSAVELAKADIRIDRHFAEKKKVKMEFFLKAQTERKILPDRWPQIEYELKWRIANGVWRKDWEKEERAKRIAKEEYDRTNWPTWSAEHRNLSLIDALPSSGIYDLYRSHLLSSRCSCGTIVQSNEQESLDNAMQNHLRIAHGR